MSVLDGPFRALGAAGGRDSSPARKASASEQSSGGRVGAWPRGQLTLSHLVALLGISKAPAGVDTKALAFN